MSRIWAGIDSGKGHHHGLALDADGKTLLSRRVANDEPELLKLIGDVLDQTDGREVCRCPGRSGRSRRARARETGLR
jgi:hypothetical protein